VNDTSPMRTAASATSLSSSSAASLTAWLEAHGACLDGVRVEQEHDDDESLRMVSTGAIARGRHLVSIPASLVLSLQTASNAVFEALLDEAENDTCCWSETSVQLMAVAYERSLGADSFWAVFFSALPDAENLPLVWSDEALALLVGTGVDANGARSWRRSIVRSRRSSVVAPLCGTRLRR
jgi:hypothetical protein